MIPSPKKSHPSSQEVVASTKRRDKSTKEIMEQLGLKDRRNFNENYLQPAIAVGLVEITIPEKPNSRLQRYRLAKNEL